MFPIKDRKGRVVGFGGRVMNPDDQPKYLNTGDTPIFQKSRELYGLFETLEFRKDLENILVVEGYMDTIALYEHGMKNSVATDRQASDAQPPRAFITNVFCAPKPSTNSFYKGFRTTPWTLRAGGRCRIFIEDGSSFFWGPGALAKVAFDKLCRKMVRKSSNIDNLTKNDKTYH